MNHMFPTNSNISDLISRASEFWPAKVPSPPPSKGGSPHPHVWISEEILSDSAGKVTKCWTVHWIPRDGIERHRFYWNQADAKEAATRIELGLELEAYQAELKELGLRSALFNSQGYLLSEIQGPSECGSSQSQTIH